MKKLLYLLLASLMMLGMSCTNEASEATQTDSDTQADIQKKLEKYTSFTLTADVSGLSENQRQMIVKLIEAGEIMDELFWREAYGPDWKSFLADLPNEDYRQYARLNYGPWDRLDGNKPFVDGVGEKPAGAQFYPANMTKEEFEGAELEDKTSLYTFLSRGEGGELQTVPYHVMFEEEVKQVSKLLQEAADLAEDEGLKKYLSLRAEALLTDDYQPSDLAWMDSKTNQIDVVIGPIENYEDQMFGYKAAHECYVLIKDMEWSGRLAKYASVLPELQRGLPVPEAYKAEMPGSNADLNAYDVVYYAGDCNAGSKTIAINLPNDEEVQLSKGTRRLQLKNAMQAKFEKILVPLAEELIDAEQRKHITFDAFFANTMFHEVAHGLGIKNTLDGSGTVREAHKEAYSALEEGKADILGLYMIQQLHAKGEVEGDLTDYYITFMASIFRSVRFGASSAHGKANMIRFNFFQERGAFSRDEETGTYKVDIPKLEQATQELTELILTLQGDGDYEGASGLIADQAQIGDQLQADLDRLAEKGIPVDIVFEQGVDVLGLGE